MTDPVRIVILEDHNAGESPLRETLMGAGFTSEIISVTLESDFRENLTRDSHVILVDTRSPESAAVRALEILREAEIDAPLIVVSDALTPDSTRALSENGVHIQIPKDRLEFLGPAVRQALEQNLLRRECRAALKTLGESETRYDAITGIALDVVFEIDAEGRFTRLSPSFADVTGWEIENWMGHTFPAIIHPEDREQARNVFHRTLVGERVNLFELRIAHRSGGYIIAEFMVIRHQAKSGERSVLGVGRDITERKRLESQSRQSQKMESLGALAGGIAHDFNNLIGIISGYCELAVESIGDDHPARPYLSQIDTAGQRAAALVQQILSIARKARVSLEPLALNQAVLDIFKLLHETFPRTVELSQDLESGLPDIIGDTSQINQILMNLCVNARDSMPSGGRLVIKTRSLTAAELPGSIPNAKHERYVCMSVSDTGTGMTEDVRKSMFDPFFSTKETAQGSGLGLAVVQGIIRNHGAHIRVDSEPGHGTTFEIYFPACSRESEETGTTQEVPETAEGTELLLLVEDESSISEMTQKALRNNGYKVVSARDGAEGLDLYKRHRVEIALVLLDLGLPKMDGIAVLERIRQTDPEMHVILSSGFLDPDQEKSLANDRFVCFLPKPYELREMLKTIRETLYPSGAS